jgi:hypothetical protein
MNRPGIALAGWDGKLTVFHVKHSPACGKPKGFAAEPIPEMRLHQVKGQVTVDEMAEIRSFRL